MIRKFTETDQEQVVNIVTKMNNGNTAVRYYPNGKQDIIKHIQRREKQSDILQLVYVLENKVVSYCDCLIDVSENYLQLLSHFSIIDYNDSLRNVFDYFYANYKGFDMHYVLSDFNTSGINFMKTTKATDDGFEKMMHISRENYVEKNVKGIEPLSDEFIEEFITVHNNVYRDAYWNGKLLLEDERFDVFIVVKEDEVTGYVVVSNFGRDEEEIYFVYSNDIDTKMDLYNKALNLRFNTASSIQVLLDPSEEKEIPLLNKIGFKLKESIITYFIKGL